MIQIQNTTTVKEPPCPQGGRREYARYGHNHNSSVTGHCGGGVLRRATPTPPSAPLPPTTTNIQGEILKALSLEISLRLARERMSRDS